MNTMATYVGNRNIARFFDQLHAEADPYQARVLQKLLLEEEDRLGRALENWNGQISNCQMPGASYGSKP